MVTQKGDCDCGEPAKITFCGRRLCEDCANELFEDEDERGGYRKRDHKRSKERND